MDPRSGAVLLPWVRLHGVRGMADMLACLEECPGARVTFNYTPVLLEQLEALVAGREDEWLRRCRRDPGELVPEEQEFLLRHLFTASRWHMIRPLRHYAELERRHHRWRRTRHARDAFRAQDFLDLVVLFHLAWSGWSVRRHPALAELVARGHGYSRADRDRVFEVHREVLGGLVPRARTLAESGQLELSTTPYQHPILPLVCGLDSRDFPHAGGSERPFRFVHPEDARDHVQRALDLFARCFGSAPVGMWPAEGAVSEAAAEVFAASGVRWIASDEDVLFRSLEGGSTTRDALYRPYRFASSGDALSVLFRDHQLSDRIGFTYQTWDHEEAATDFLASLEAIRAPLSRDAATVAVILDGENPWENYRDSGGPFLRALYRRLADASNVTLCTVSEALERGASSTGRLPRLAPGSWIHGSLDTWAGHAEKLGAWRLLAGVRELAGERPLRELPEPLAESLRVLEGSDWYWWLGDDHFTPTAEIFDHLFLAHWRRAHELLGREPPDPGPLRTPRGGDLRPERLPTASIEPQGRPADLLQWESAGVVELTARGGSMTEVAAVSRRLLYGFSGAILHLAVAGPGNERALRLVFRRDAGEVAFAPENDPPDVQGSWLRFRVPLEEVAAPEAEEVLLRVEAREEAGEARRWPETGWIHLPLPTGPRPALQWFV